MRNNILVKMLLFKVLMAISLSGCAETIDAVYPSLLEQFESTYYEKEYVESIACERDIIAELLAPLYHTREDAIQLSHIQFDWFDKDGYHIIEEGTFDYRRFFTLIEGSLFPEEIEGVLAGEITTYEVFQRQPRTGSRMIVDSSIILETQNGNLALVSFRRDNSLLIGPHHDPFISAPSLEDLLRNVGVEESIHATSLDLERTRVLLLNGLSPIRRSTIGFLFSDGENEYFLAPVDWVYDPHDFKAAEYLLPEEIAYFTMYAGEFYAAAKALQFIAERREVADRAREREEMAWREAGLIRCPLHGFHEVGYDCWALSDFELE